MSAVAWFKDVGIADRPTVGGKGGSLGELTRAGIAVPPGFVVTTSGFERFLAALEAREPVRTKVEALDPNDLGAATKLSEELRRRVIEEPMPIDVEQAIRAAHAELSPNGEPVAVRSSATTEDAEDASFAGLQDTFLWVLGADKMVARVRECWGSLYSVESMTYRRKQAFPEDGVAMAVVVQRMVDAMCAGVMFTRSPTTGDKSVITIEGAWGLGSAVVSGEVTPDRWVLGKITGEISVRDISDKHARQVPADGGGIVEVENEPDRRKHAIPEEGVAMAVVVQRMVDAMCAGVMFTRSPTTGDKSVITIEGAWGLGSAVVSGEVTPDRWVLGKITGEISVRDISDKHARQVPAEGGGIVEVENEAGRRKAPCLTDAQLMALREVGRKIERHYGKPQDIEWALDQDGNVLLLQSRPETVWSAKDAAPVAAASANPLSHVMGIFGGRK